MFLRYAHRMEPTQPITPETVAQWLPVALDVAKAVGALVIAAITALAMLWVKLGPMFRESSANAAFDAVGRAGTIAATAYKATVGQLGVLEADATARDAAYVTAMTGAVQVGWDYLVRNKMADKVIGQYGDEQLARDAIRMKVREQSGNHVPVPPL